MEEMNEDRIKSELAFDSYGRHAIVRDIIEANREEGQKFSVLDVGAGERKFLRTCAPCHGKTLAGDGPVAANFMPPPDLLAEATRARKDGFLYSYIRFGGIVMPPYGAQVTAEEAWNLVNYLRSMQQKSPR